MARGDEFEFDKGEDVLAYHGPLIYEAQVRDRVLKNPLQGHATSKLKLYRIHYTNWNDHWDEWVAESRVLRVDEANKRLQQERIREFHRAFKRKSNHKTEVEAPKRQKSEEVPLQDVREALRLPHSMKLKLLEDWERITRERKLVPLPRSPSISEMLEEFLQTKAKRSSHERLYGEVVDGIRSYFNQALNALLLYKYERKQYRDLKEEDKAKPLVDIYGAEHLLRLYVKLPELLVQCSLQKDHMTVLLAKLVELLKFMQVSSWAFRVNQCLFGKLAIET
ncbi:MAG: hypothetical protein SGPRY_004902 [Prymnesium sp.]